MQAQREAPTDLQCKDKFLVQSVAAENGAATQDITAPMVPALSLPFFCIISVNLLFAAHIIISFIFVISRLQFNKEPGKVVDECKLRVIYVRTSTPGSISEESEQGSSARSFENGTLNSTIPQSVSH